MNVYEYKNELVAVVKQTPEHVTFITASGKQVEVPQKDAIVTEAKLVCGGIYNDKFVQAAVGGLVEPPKYIAKSGGMMLYRGKLVRAFVEPHGNGLVAYAAGVDSSAWGNGAQDVNNSKVPGGKMLEMKPSVPKPDGRSFNGTQAVEQAEAEDEMDGTPKTLPIATPGGALSNVHSITIKWIDKPEVSGTIQDIKDMFGEGKTLPAPDSIAVETDTEKIVSKKNKGTDSKKTVSDAGAPEETSKETTSPDAMGMPEMELPKAAGTYTDSVIKKTAGGVEFGFQGTMAHSCRDCQGMTAYETEGEKTFTVCSLCGKKEKYERI